MGVGFELLRRAVVFRGASFLNFSSVLYIYLPSTRRLFILTSSLPPSLPPALQLWDHNPNMLDNRGVSEASYILLGSTVAASIAAGFVTLSASPDVEEKKK